MLRGVNKRIIEVTDTGNEYFERAILFLKYEKQNDDEKKIKESACNYLKNVESFQKRKKLNRFSIAAVKYGSVAALGAVITALVLRI